MLSGLAFVGLSWALTSNLRAQVPAAPVIVGTHPVANAHVKSALAQCDQNAPELKPAACLDRYFVPRWLLDEKAKADELSNAAAVRDSRREILASKLLEDVARAVSEPSQKEIDSYLEKHPRDFKKPLRIRIFRILVSSEAKAEAVLKSLDQTTTVSDFRALCREHSIDRATNERAGDLGFVWPDGSTDVPQVSAETGLYEAALKLRDGEFSQAPIPEKDHFAIIWRRGSLPAQEIDAKSGSIARLRVRERTADEAKTSLLTELSHQVSARDDERLGKLRRSEASLFQEP